MLFRSGTSVTVTASKVDVGAIAIGAASEPSGAVIVNSTGYAYDAGDGPITLGAISAKGGTTVTVTQTATSSTSDAVDNVNIGAERTQSNVTVTGGDDTTEVTVIQSAAVTAKDGSAASAAGTKEVAVATFSPMAKGDTTEIGRASCRVRVLKDL